MRYTLYARDYIYVVVYNDARFAYSDRVIIQSAYRSRRAAYRAAGKINKGRVLKTALVPKKFERPDPRSAQSTSVPKKISNRSKGLFYDEYLATKRKKIRRRRSR